MRKSLFSSLLLRVADAQTPGAHVPLDGVPMPFYFSSTNSRAMGEAYILPPVPGIPYPPQFIRAELLINDNLVRVWQAGPGDIPEQHKWLGVMFDSSFFNYWSTVTVKFKAWDSHGQFYYDEGQAPIKNRATLVGRYDLEVDFLNYQNGQWYGPYPSEDQWKYRALPSSDGRLQEMNYMIGQFRVNQGWTALDFASDIVNCNVIHLHSHMTPDHSFSDSDDYWFQYYGSAGPKRNIYGSTVPPGAPTDSVGLLPIRQFAIGAGLPPYNDTHLPPVNLCFFDGCGIGATNVVAEGALYPYGNFYTGVGEFPEDQCAIGYEIAFHTAFTYDVNEAFWGALDVGLTAHDARFEAWIIYGGSNRPNVATAFMHVWGDFYTTLKGVYRGLPTEDSEIIWYRNL